MKTSHKTWVSYSTGSEAGTQVEDFANNSTTKEVVTKIVSEKAGI